MVTQQFNELLQRVEEMDAIACNNKKPSRPFKFSAHDVESVKKFACRIRGLTRTGLYASRIWRMNIFWKC